MKILIEESVLRQALEALPNKLPDNFVGLGKYYMEHMSSFAPPQDSMKAFKIKWLESCEAASTTLRTALDAAEKVEPRALDINSMDAVVWAKAFAERFTVWSQEHGVESDTFGLMVGWFANAIMAGYDEATRRNPAPTVPEGWQLVPVDPTEEMLVESKIATDVGRSYSTRIYKAMLSAAPKMSEDV